jgi:ssDNA thymidine ADP-ribosyltransferase, DarT
MPVPDPTPIYRFIHVDNLPVVLQRGGLHAPNHTPNDGLCYKTIHNREIQEIRRIRKIDCGPRGVIHDYVSFYFGPRSPMLFQLHTGRVAGYDEGQEPLIYLVSTAQAVVKSGIEYVFSDGHGIAAFTEWYDNLNDLDKVDWELVNAHYWADTINDMDRQRRKQAEFLVHRFCDWGLVQEICVLNPKMIGNVEHTMAQFPRMHRPQVRVQREWYY